MALALAGLSGLFPGLHQLPEMAFQRDQLKLGQDSGTQGPVSGQQL